jgi:hypothetical protein
MGKKLTFCCFFVFFRFPVFSSLFFIFKDRISIALSLCFTSLGFLRNNPFNFSNGFLEMPASLPFFRFSFLCEGEPFMPSRSSRIL